MEQLAWSSAQLHCHLSVDEQKIRLPGKLNSQNWIDSKASSSGRDTSFNACKGERGVLIFSTEPRILFCDLLLKPNQSETFTFTGSIPSGSPPSYTGHALRYVYKITIGTQRLNSVVQFLKVPLKIVLGPESPSHSLETCKKSSLECNGDLANSQLNCSQQSNFTSPEDVFDAEDTNPASGASLSAATSRNELREHVLDVMMQKIDCLSAKRSPNTFVITNPNGRVAKFWILKSTFKLGEDVVGVFDFQDAEIPCVQVIINLSM